MAKTTQELLKELKDNKVVQAIPKLHNTILQLERSIKWSNKIGSRDAILISLMADGLDYDEAYTQANRQFRL